MLALKLALHFLRALLPILLYASLSLFVKKTLYLCTPLIKHPREEWPSLRLRNLIQSALPIKALLSGKGSRFAEYRASRREREREEREERRERDGIILPRQRNRI